MPLALPLHWRGLAVVGTWLIGWAVAVNLLLLALTQAGAMAWLPDRQTGTGFVVDNQERVAAAVAEYRAGKVPPSDYLVAVTGISNAREGVDVDVLRDRLGPGVRVLGVAGAGAGAPSVVENASTILDGNLRPDVVVLGLAPLQLLDTFADPTAPPPTPAVAPSLKDRVRGWVTRWVWPFARRNDVSISVDRTLLTARAALFGAAGVQLETPDVRSPWRPMMRVMGAEHYPDEVLQRSLLWAESIGALDKSAYARSTKAPAMIGDLIRRFEGNGARVVVVMTPEHSLLRNREPAGVMPLITAKLRQEARSPQLEVIDLRDAIGDNGMVDLSHPNTAGSKAFSAILAERIGRPDPSRKPLMANYRYTAPNS